MKPGYLLTCLAGCLFNAGALANDALALRDGLLVDPGAQVVFVMLPAGGIAALEVADGATQWQSDAADRPISLDQGVLLAQVDTAIAGRMDLASLAADTGLAQSNQSLTIDKAVMPIIDEHLGTRFELRRYGPDERQVAWKYESRTVQGMPSANPPPVVSVAGAFSVADGAARVSAVTTPGKAQLDAIWHQPSLLAGQTIARARGQQFRSINGAHVLAARHEPTDGRWDAWIWEVYGADGSALGTTRSFMGYSPFAVIEGTLLFVTQPFTRRLPDGQYENQPLMLRAVDLASGREAWTREIRDTRYYGPYPV